MAASVIVDASFLVTLLSHSDSHHRWGDRIARERPPPWITCEAVISEAFLLLTAPRAAAFAALLRRDSIAASFRFDTATEQVLDLMHKYADVPMSFADACLVRMTEMLPDPVLLTTDADFRIYRRHGRQVVPCFMPG
jgi:predicted nucleic acid-binding protein